MDYESDGIRQAREERRGSLSARIGELIHTLSGAGPAENLAWYRRNRGKFYFESGELQDRVALINCLVPSRKDDVVAAADRLLRHEFDILGSGVVSLGNPIDWQLDFKSGIRWRNDVIYPAWNWRKVEDLAGAEIFRGHFYSIDDPSDLKVPWDLSSFFHLPVLAEAFLQTGDPRYEKEAIDELRDWDLQNPYPRGVNWTCAMAVGIRLANIVFGLRVLEPAEFLGAAGVILTLRHIKFILDFLEVDQDGRRNNHYVNDLVGLGFGAVEIAGSDAGSALLDFVCEELSRELLIQFSSDGTNYEGTIPYHRFAAESAIVTAILLEQNGRPMPPEVRDQLRRIVRFIDFYTKPNGLASQYGDNDNGRILVLHDYAAQEYRDHRHILAVGAAWLGMDGLTTNVADQNPDVVWLFGRPAPEPFPAPKPEILSGLYARNGYALARAADSSFLIRCGRINPMSGGGHNHCDQLSFEFHDRGQDLVIDPGAIIYSANAGQRNHFRSTAAHNTLQLDDLEQQQFSPTDLFAMQERAEASIDVWEVVDSVVLFRGHHVAYREAGWEVSRECRCDLRAGTLRVQDWVTPLTATTSGAEFCGRLHFASGVQVEETLPAVCNVTAGERQWRIHIGNHLHIRLVNGEVSPGYGVALPAVILEYRFSPSRNRRAGFVLERV